MAKQFVSNKDETARLFKSDFLEKFTHVHWSVPIIVYLPVVVYFLYRAATMPSLSLSNLIVLFVVGVVFWSLTEYVLHRWVFHYHPKSALGQRLHFLLHGVHHDYPMDSTRLVMPPSVSIPLAVLFYGLFILVLGDVYMYLGEKEKAQKAFQAVLEIIGDEMVQFQYYVDLKSEQMEQGLSKNPQPHEARKHLELATRNSRDFPGRKEAELALKELG